jgi:RNA polymerase sigma-70 factor (ECF subfamily)
MSGDPLRRAADALNQGVDRRVEGNQALQALLRTAARGDDDALAALRSELESALVRYLKVIAPDAAEDLVAETWLQVLRGLDQFDGDESAFRSWVFTIARKQAIDQRLHPGRAARQAPAERMTPDAGDATSNRAVLTLIATLPPDQAEVVTLRMIVGLGVAEVAKVTDKGPATVRTLTHQALLRLAKQLKTTSGDDHRDDQVAEERASIKDRVVGRETKAREAGPCPYCAYAASDPEELRQHLLHSHSDTEDVSVIGPEQDLESRDDLGLVGPPEVDAPYLATVAPSRRMGPEGEPCPYCAHLAPNPDELRMHLLHLHPEVEPEPDWLDSDEIASMISSWKDDR